jgi:arginine deiminase
LNEWRNIQDIVRSTFKALCEVVRSQGIAIRELEKQVATKASKSELNSGLNIKANVADVMRTFSEVASNIESRPTLEEIQNFLDEKVSKTDLQVTNFLLFYINF